MDAAPFDRDTLLDLSVNIIPLGIIAFFVVLFVVAAPFGLDTGPTVVQLALLIAPFGVLAVLTYYAGKAVSRDEAELDGEAGEYATVASEATPEPTGDDAGTTDDEHA